MQKKLLFLSGLLLVSAPCYAVDFDVATETTQLNFGKAVQWASTSTVGVSSNGSPLWLRCMKGSGSVADEPAAGTITFSVADLPEGYSSLVIVPTVTSSTRYPLINGTDCTLDVTNLSFSTNSITLTGDAKSGSFNVGGSLQIAGYCSSAYSYTGNISIPYNVQDSTQAVLKSGAVSLPVSFSSQLNASTARDSDMNFGTIITNGEAGSVTMSFTGDITAQTGGVVKLSGATTAGQISIYGAPNGVIKGVTTDESIFLSNGENKITVDTFTKDPAGEFNLTESRNGQGYRLLRIGGTLHFGAGQAAGTYTGTLNVRISY